MNNTGILVTSHAKEQAKKRMGLSEKAIIRLAERAIDKGVYESQMNGTVKITYGEKCFIMCERRVITVYDINMKSPFFRTYVNGKQKIVQNKKKYKT